ncbi:hypothetical protein [Streptococcus sanguinis]|jgi:hypothetical protein|uniref:Uncharacterized protein n=1 Tax=Streptococcus sanguinis TaxID=1305 RepID=A0A2X3VEZ4_STRSA|nr:hypothetical protein [Streptococcus sanguinis]ETD07265.1 hypothetical protein HMPREF1196_01533 [Streptococcus sanguinis CC94A]MCY7014432.1 hypothetical protein [Streptococcus sanguinis]SQF36075.1 Uncharacterised protein [Streptococcus sanguinis]
MVMIVLNESFERRLNEAHIEKMKSQEREAIRAFLLAKRMEIHAMGAMLNISLKLQATLMKEHATTYSTNIEGGFSGTAGDAAKDYLASLKTPNLQSPIK